MRVQRAIGIIKGILILLALLSGLTVILWDYLPERAAAVCLCALCCGAPVFIILWDRLQKRRLSDFANDICMTVDALMEGRDPENYHPWEESAASKAEGKLLQYYEKMKDGQRQSRQDKQTIQELVSDISHQVKTPVASIRMFTGILKQHSLTDEKRKEFLDMMEAQVNKLDFLLQSLVKMSRLETGTFVLHIEENSLYHTIAQSVSGIWAMAERKGIRISVDCDSHASVKHDPKWTSEALGNILDNAVKYTPEGGSITISVRPWQFYTRIDIKDTGIGISGENYNDIFKRFYRAQETAALDGVGLGLYLSRSIITRQNGYISVKSNPGKGTVFSVFLIN